jgi:hypothetical protein
VHCLCCSVFGAWCRLRDQAVRYPGDVDSGLWSVGWLLDLGLWLMSIVDSVDVLSLVGRHVFLLEQSLGICLQ